MGIETVLLIGAAAFSAASAGSQAYSSKRAGDKAELQADRQNAEQAALLKAEQDRQAESDKVAGLSADMARKRQRQKASGWGSNTILTSPLGLPGTAPTANKTLLGQ